MKRPVTIPSQNGREHDGEQIAFLNSILESSTEYSIVALDLEGTITAWNEGAHRLYGYEPGEVLGKANVSLLHDPEAVNTGPARAIFDDARENGMWSGELRRIRKNGSPFTAYVTLTIRSDAHGKPIGFTMISRDLTPA